MLIHTFAASTLRARRLANRVAVAALALGATIGTASSAHADLFRVIGIPDFDQVRSGLPLNGSMHCAPTSTTDALYFLAHHGFPEVVDGSGDIYNYSEVASNIAWLGNYMGTGSGGTTNYTQGLKDWLADHSDTLFAVIKQNSWSNPIEMKNMRGWVEFNSVATYGHIVLNDDPNFPAGSQHKVKGGTHTMMLTGAGVDDATGKSYIYYNNPATSESPPVLTAQSPFVTDMKELVPATVQISGVAGDEPLTLLNRVGTNYYVWTLAAIVPSYLMTNVESGIMLRFHRPLQLEPIGPVAENMHTGGDGELVDIALDRFYPSAKYLQSDSSIIWSTDLITGEPSAFAEVRGATRLASGGGDGSLYVASDEGITALDSSGRETAHVRTREPVEGLAIDPGGGGRDPVDGLAIDPGGGGNRLVAVSRADGLVSVYDADLNLTATYPLPPVESEGRLVLRADGEGRLWLHADRSPEVTEMEFNRDGHLVSRAIRLETQGRPEGMHVARGLLFFAEDGELHEYTEEGSRSHITQFAGLTGVGRLFTMMSDFDDTDPAVDGFEGTLPAGESQQ